MDLKEEFIEWIYKNSNPNLTSVGIDTISNNIDESNKYFDRDIMDVDESNYIEMIEYLKEELYRTNKAFQEYNASVASGRPRAILGKENYFKFLEKKFGPGRKDDANYWIFQCNPAVYDLQNALKAKAVHSWKVAAHKDKIKPGDKAIIWQTGPEAGCLALGEILTAPGLIAETVEETNFYKGESYAPEETRVKMKLLYNFVDDPLKWSEIKDLPEFQNFKAGNQGTNFRATKEEFETIQEMKQEAKVGVYWKVKKLFPEEKVEKFLDVLRHFIQKHQLDPRDERLNFSVRPSRKRLAFVIGNRYALAIESINGKITYSIIHPEILSEKHGNFVNNKGETETHWGQVYSLEGLEEKIEEGLKTELDRNHKNPNRRTSNKDFIADVMGYEIKTQNILMKKDEALNTILYGPPGTGKTYYSKELAVRLANPQFSVEDITAEESRAKINEEYQRLYDLGQIVFTTFHQSFSYEDFVEGIKPLTPEKEGAPITYEVQNGVFKNLCLKAKTPNQQNFDSAYASLVKDLALDQEVKKIKTPTGKTFGISLNSLNNLNLHTGEQMKKQGALTRENILREISQEEDYPYWKGYFQGVINHLAEKYDYREKMDLATGNYVLIIDEINRGNVSAIFGELITLLEADKRKGKDEEISVELPYSKKPFTVPSNLYLIGTMNTADRSVEALDTALRRRFVFEEIMPQPELLRDIEFDGFNLEELLSTINQRIEALLDRDHTIGHSYFIKINSGDSEVLKEAFENKIIPLLQEYFYHDYEKIALILGEGFIERKDAKLKFAKFSKIDLPEVLPSYHLREIKDIESAVRILLNREDEAGE